MMLISSIIFLITNPSKLLTSAISASNSTITLCLSLMGIYIFWSGMLEIVSDTGLSNKIAKFLKPLIKFLFGEIDEETASFIALNISANLLGLGNASTPSGLEAMKRLNNNKSKPSYKMAILLAINCCSIQLLPTTIISMRELGGSYNSSDIILPILIVSIVSIIYCISMVKLFYRGKKDE